MRVDATQGAAQRVRGHPGSEGTRGGPEPVHDHRVAVGEGGPHLLQGRIEPDSLSVAFRTTLEANGWKHLSSTTASDKGTTQVYEKQGSSLQVLIYESWYYTWVEMSATRMVGTASASLK